MPKILKQQISELSKASYPSIENVGNFADIRINTWYVGYYNNSNYLMCSNKAATNDESEVKFVGYTKSGSASSLNKVAPNISVRKNPSTGKLFIFSSLEEHYTDQAKLNAVAILAHNEFFNKKVGEDSAGLISTPLKQLNQVLEKGSKTITDAQNDILKNTSDLSNISAKVSTNEGNISYNGTNISSNLVKINKNELDIATLKLLIKDDNNYQQGTDWTDLSSFVRLLDQNLNQGITLTWTNGDFVTGSLTKTSGLYRINGLGVDNSATYAGTMEPQFNQLNVLSAIPLNNISSIDARVAVIESEITLIKKWNMLIYDGAKEVEVQILSNTFEFDGPNGTTPLFVSKSWVEWQAEKVEYKKLDMISPGLKKGDTTSFKLKDSSNFEVLFNDVTTFFGVFDASNPIRKNIFFSTTFINNKNSAGDTLGVLTVMLTMNSDGTIKIKEIETGATNGQPGPAVTLKFLYSSRDVLV